MDIEEMLIEQCKKRGIDMIAEGVDFFEKIKFTFSKEGKQYSIMFPTREVLDIQFKKTWVSQLIRKAETELNH